MAIRPLSSEADHASEIVAKSSRELDAVLDALGDARLPREPLPRLLALTERFRYSYGPGADALAATANSPCWAVNLAATAQGQAFNLSKTPLPFPGLVQRRLFRADRDATARQRDVQESLLCALHDTACDIATSPRASDIFAQTFPNQRRHSRLYAAWMLLFGLGGITPAQLARALSATNAGAGKLLRQLEASHLARGTGPFAPYVSAVTLTVSLQDWRFAMVDDEDAKRID